MGFIDIQKRIKSLDKAAMIKKAVNANSDEAISLNKEQLKHGIGIDGAKLTPEYSNPLYAAKKNAQNPKAGFGTPDLLLKGDFQEGFTTKITGEKLTIFSTDFKESFLPKRYPKGQGLTKENTDKLNYDITQTYINNWVKLIL